MDESQRIFGHSAGSPSATIMFIGEAPGRLGADETHIPFHGDASGRNFERFIDQVGLRRADLFITNAVLCNPRAPDGNNSTPTLAEVHNCARFLASQIDIVKPKIIVTLGATALRALRAVENHAAELSTHVRTVVPWQGRKLIPLYHPGQRALIHRSFHNQLADYQFVAEQWQRAFKPAKRASPASKPRIDVIAVAAAIVAATGRVSYFALHKLVFLLEHKATEQLGHAVSSAHFIRQKDGPYCVQLHYKTLRLSDSLRVIQSTKGLALEPAAPLLGLSQPFPDDVSALIESVASSFGKLSDSQLKTRVYLTSPMKKLLRLEKAGHNMFNAPIIIKK